MALIICLQKCDNDKVLANYIAAKDTAMAVTIKGISAEFNKALEVESQKQMALIMANNDTLKKLATYFKKVTNTITIKDRFEVKHDTITLPDTIPCDFKPINFAKTNNHYELFGRIDSKNLFLDSLKIHDKISLVLGQKKTHLFKPSEQQVVVVHSNPYMQTDAIQNLTLKEKKKWFERPIFWFGAGVITAVTVKAIVQ
jgi:hypothetical protein